MSKPKLRFIYVGLVASYLQLFILIAMILYVLISN